MFKWLKYSIAGVVLAPILFHFQNAWQSQGFAFIAVALSGYALSLNIKPLRYVPDKALSWLCLWVFGSAIYINWMLFLKVGINFNFIYPTIAFLCAIIIHKIITEYLSVHEVYKTICFLKWVVLFNLLFCVLQFFGYDQIFLYFKEIFDYNHVLGFLFNSTMLSIFLGMTSAIFWSCLNRQNVLTLCLIFLILMNAGTNIESKDVCASGLVLFFLNGIYFNWHKIKNNWMVTSLIAAPFCFLGLIYIKNNPIFLANNGRLEMWGLWYKIFTTLKINDIVSGTLTGFGTGFIYDNSKYTTIPKAFQVHNEYFQYTIELGLIGLFFILNLIGNFFKMKADSKAEKIFKAMIVCFLLACVLNPVSHVWVISLIAIISYSCLKILNCSINEHQQEGIPC